MPKQKPDTKRAVRYVKKLMAIPGAGGCERAVADFIRQEMTKAGARASQFETDRAFEKTPVRGDIGNMAFHLPGTIRGPRRMLMAHMDTVPLCVGCKPVVKGKFIRPAESTTGLGADDRAGCAVLLNTAVELLQSKVDHPPLTFLWTIQEEGGLHGARHCKLSLLKRPKLAFNFDGGSSKKLTIGATGGYRMSINVHGIASHAGNRPEAGASAIEIASRAIAKLSEDGWHGSIKKNGKQGTSNVGIISGGDATNVVSNFCELRVEARSHDPKFRETIVARIKKEFEQAAKRVKSSNGDCGSIDFEGRLDYESFLLSKDEPSVVEAQQAVRDLGFEPTLAIANGGLDANWMSARGIPTVSLGCGQLNQHTTDEALDIAEFEDACRIGYRLATGNN